MTTKRADRDIRRAINKSNATESEKDRLLEIYSVEGFGGKEDRVRNVHDARALVEDRLAWARDCRF